MKKLIWFICIYNLILFLFSFPCFASVKGGYNPGPLNSGIKMKDVKPFEKREMVLYENEWAMIFSNSNIGPYTTSDQRYVKVTAEYEPHAVLEPHEVSKDCNNSSENHTCHHGSVIKTLTDRHYHITKSYGPLASGGCDQGTACGGKLCTKNLKYPNPIMVIEVETEGPIFVISDSLNESSTVKNFNYTSMHGLVGGNGEEERTFMYIVNNIADFKNDYSDGFGEGSGESSEDDDDSDDEDDSWDVDEDGEWDPDDWDEETDPDTGHTTSTYKWADLEALAGSASGSYKSNGSISYSSAFNINNTYPLSGTSDKWFTDGVNWYYKYSEGDNPKKKWVSQGGDWWFITSTSRTSIELQLPPTEPDPSTGDPGGEERTKEISVWEVTFAQDEYLLISSGAEYRLYEFDGDGYLTADTTNGYKNAKFNKSGKVIKS